MFRIHLIVFVFLGVATADPWNVEYVCPTPEGISFQICHLTIVQGSIPTFEMLNFTRFEHYTGWLHYIVHPFDYGPGHHYGGMSHACDCSEIPFPCIQMPEGEDILECTDQELHFNSTHSYVCHRHGRFLRVIEKEMVPNEEIEDHPPDQQYCHNNLGAASCHGDRPPCHYMGGHRYSAQCTRVHRCPTCWMPHLDRDVFLHKHHEGCTEPPCDVALTKNSSFLVSAEIEVENPQGFAATFYVTWHAEIINNDDTMWTYNATMYPGPTQIEGVFPIVPVSYSFELPLAGVRSIKVWAVVTLIGCTTPETKWDRSDDIWCITGTPAPTPSPVPVISPINMPMTFHDADDYCHDNFIDGHLVSIHDSLFNAEISGHCDLLTNHNGGCWIGLRGDNTESCNTPAECTLANWEWNDGTDLDYINFCGGCPDNFGNDTEDCTMMYHEDAFAPTIAGEWNDETCDNMHAFICSSTAEISKEYFNVTCDGTCEDCAAECTAHGCSQLAVIHSQADNDAAAAQCPHNEECWIGLTAGSTVEFADATWVDGSSLDYGLPPSHPPWDAGHPNIPINHDRCVTIKHTTEDGVWNDRVDSDTEHTAVCVTTGGCHPTPTASPAPFIVLPPAPAILLDFEGPPEPIWTWGECVVGCIENGMCIAGIRNEADNEFVQGLCRQYNDTSDDNCWIGVHETHLDIPHAEGNHLHWYDKWHPTPIDAGYGLNIHDPGVHPWGADQPNHDSDTHCAHVYMNNGHSGWGEEYAANPKWWDTSSNNENYCICRVDPSPQECELPLFTLTKKAGHWHEVYEECSTATSCLASIHSDEENTEVDCLCDNINSDDDETHDDDRCWLGGIESTQDNCEFRWVDGTPMDYGNNTVPDGQYPWVDGFSFADEPDCNDDDCYEFMYWEHDHSLFTFYSGWSARHEETSVYYGICRNDGPCAPLNDTFFIGGTGDGGFGTEDLEWHEAVELCAMEGGCIASIHSHAELQEAHLLCELGGNHTHHCWIGTHVTEGSCADDTFTWYDGTPVDYINWSTNEPNCETEFLQATFLEHDKEDGSCGWHDGKKVDSNIGGARAMCRRGPCEDAYFPTPEQYHWHGAYDWCAQSAGCLASVTDHDTADDVGNTCGDISGAERCWIGGYESSDNCTFSWVDGANADYINNATGQAPWEVGQPDVCNDTTCFEYVFIQSQALFDRGDGETDRYGICVNHPCNPVLSDVFFISGGGENWDVAAADCAVDDGCIASIHNTDEEFLANLLCRIHDDAGTHRCWLGLRTDGSTCVDADSFFWHDGTPVDYESWRVGGSEPDCGGDDRAARVRHSNGNCGWDDSDPTNEHPAVCRVEACPPTPAPSSPPSTP